MHLKQTKQTKQTHAAKPALLAFALCATLFTAQSRAQVDPGVPDGGRQVQIMKDSAYGNIVEVVYRGRFSYVRIERRETGAEANQHPFEVSVESLRAALGNVSTGSGKDSEPLFDKTELDELAAPLAKALARAKPEHDVSFAVPGKHGGLLGSFASRSITTGRVFRRAGKLEVVIGLARQEFEGQFRSSGVLIPFEPGMRSKTVDRSANISVASASGLRKRADWVVLNVDATSSAALQGVSPEVMNRAIEAAKAAARDAVLAGQAGATPAAAASAAPATTAVNSKDGEADTLFKQVSERLKALQRLKESGAINEAEYQEKRKDILKSL